MSTHLESGLESGASAEARIVARALELGFVRVGFAPAARSGRAAERLERWLARGLHGEMTYMEGPLDRADPLQLLPEAETVIVVALPYGEQTVALRRGPTDTKPLRGVVARYARGEDYHRILKIRLARLAEAIAGILGRAVRSRSCTDSAPIAERDFAERAGIGFSAKSTLTIVPGVGSYVLLGELLVDVALDARRARPQSSLEEGCGGCTRCLSACPTGAFVGPHILDARRCISYLTIELKGSIPRDLRPLIGNRVFGCDVCQEVCPWNGTRHAPAPDAELGERASLRDPDLAELIGLTSSGYRRLVKGTALARTSRARLARNAAIALGNSRDPAAEAPLIRALETHASEVVRESAAWALGELARSGVQLEAGAAVLERASRLDPCAEVRREAALALPNRTAPPA